MKDIIITAFNAGNAGNYVNGPGICLVNFIKILNINNINTRLYTKLPSSFIKSSPISELNKPLKSDLLIHWSGLNNEFIGPINLAAKHEIKTIIGPNVIDTVNFDNERIFLSKIKYNKILTVNDKLKFMIARSHKIDHNNICTLTIGPDLDLWKNNNLDTDNTILWKGNSSQIVKDISFALELQKQLPQYKFKFIGYPKPYNYLNHIDDAKKSKIQILTSLSETMGQAGLEGFASGLPAIAHPDIFACGQHYKTGIIVSKTIDNYKKAIIEIMEDKELYNHLKYGSIDYVNNNFSNKITFEMFKDIYKCL